MKFMSLFSDMYSKCNQSKQGKYDLKEPAYPKNHWPTGEKWTKIQTHTLLFNYIKY